MSPQDLVETFTNMTMCTLPPQRWSRTTFRGSWVTSAGSAGGNMEQPSWPLNPYITFKVKEPSVTYVTLAQQDPRLGAR